MSEKLADIIDLDEKRKEVGIKIAQVIQLEPAEVIEFPIETMEPEGAA